MRGSARAALIHFSQYYSTHTLVQTYKASITINTSYPIAGCILIHTHIWIIAFIGANQGFTMSQVCNSSFNKVEIRLNVIEMTYLIDNRIKYFLPYRLKTMREVYPPVHTPIGAPRIVSPETIVCGFYHHERLSSTVLLRPIISLTIVDTFFVIVEDWSNHQIYNQG